MKISDTTRKRFHNVKWVALWTAWAILALAVSPAALAIPLVSFGLLFVIFSKRIAWWKISWQERRQIKAQPNVHQRGYILQRLAMLPYQESEQLSVGTTIYTVSDADQTVTLSIYHKCASYAGDTYLIDFTHVEFVGAVTIGNQYRYTTDNYTVSSNMADIRYDRRVWLRESGQAERVECESTDAMLDHLPDEVIERVEYALLHWEVVSLDT